MKIKILSLLSFLLLISCKSQNLQRSIKVISAEKTSWIGGVKGVRGENFSIQVAYNGKTAIEFPAVETNGERIPTQTTKKGNLYHITASISHHETEETAPLYAEQPSAMAKPAKVEHNTPKQKDKQFYLIYKNRHNNKEGKIKIDSFKKQSSLPIYP